MSQETPNDRPAPEGRTWRQIFTEDLKPLDLDVRVKQAREATEETLRALCYDPNPKVVRAVFENPRAGLDHARLVAEHHRSGQGLDALANRGELLRDRQVERFLLRNPQTSERLLQRMIGSKRMSEVYRLAMSRDSTERMRASLKKSFRKKFMAGSAAERVGLIVRTEGRCLSLLIGLALESKSAALLCRRPLASTLLIQNLARWPATPPQVLRHLARQPMVRRSQALKNLVLRHPNTPQQLKGGP